MIYKHFRGKFYIRLFEARDCDDCTKVYTIYMSLYKNDFNVGQCWIRKSSIFNDIHPVHNVKRLRHLTFKEHLLFIMGLSNRIK